MNDQYGRRFTGQTLSESIDVFLVFAVDKLIFLMKTCLAECGLRQVPLQSECLATLIHIIEGSTVQPCT